FELLIRAYLLLGHGRDRRRGARPLCFRFDSTRSSGANGGATPGEPAPLSGTSLALQAGGHRFDPGTLHHASQWRLRRHCSLHGGNPVSPVSPSLGSRASSGELTNIDPDRSEP